MDYLAFLSAYLRERCSRLSSEEEEILQTYIDEQDSLAAELRVQPWSINDDNEDDPLLAENKYIQA